MGECGLQCVTTTGHYKMLLLSVENLITKVSTVIYIYIYIYIYIKYKKHFIKMLKDVGMVVPKIKETRL